MAEPDIDLFTNRAPNLEQGVVLDQITAGMKAMAAMLTTLLPPTRFRSLAMTRLEETSMWAKKAAVFTVATDVANSPVVVADACVACGHREYDHLTEDGSCWKCLCPAWLAEEVCATCGFPDSDHVEPCAPPQPVPCPGDTDGDGNCPIHSHCATGRLWGPGERWPGIRPPLAPSRSVVDDRRSEQ